MASAKVESLAPIKYELAGWKALLVIATSHPEAFERVEVAERLIRLGREFAPDLTGASLEEMKIIARIVESWDGAASSLPVCRIGQETE